MTKETRQTLSDLLSDKCWLVVKAATFIDEFESLKKFDLNPRDYLVTSERNVFVRKCDGIVVLCIEQ